MTKSTCSHRLGRALVALTLASGLSTACERSEPAPPAGQALYLRHCASCHGPEGKGNGPIAASLRTAPADLTKIAANNGGRFDEREVLRTIDGTRQVTGHGSREMPVWGVVFADELAGQPYSSYVVLLRAGTLTDYLRSIQAR